MALFKYVDDKDIFQKFYTRSLAKRLISGSSVSNDLEMVIISQLKSACGYEYTSKLQRMFTDISISAGLVIEYKEYMRDNSDNTGAEFNVQVLTAGSWPLSGNSQLCTLPPEVCSILT